jgi:hypothetical protein
MGDVSKKEKIEEALDSIEAKVAGVSGQPPDVSEELETLREETGATAPSERPAPAPEPEPEPEPKAKAEPKKDDEKKSVLPGGKN